MIAPRAGLLLHASCSDCYVAEIRSVGTDDNDAPAVDVLVFDINEILHWPDEDEKGELNPLTRAELPAGAFLVLRDVLYRTIGEDGIILNLPDGGCFRCSKLFTMCEPGGVRYQDMLHPTAEALRRDPGLTYMVAPKADA